ncbi:MAG: hypothetical protein GF393_06825, partial [Armatimonadia bacterium]|nr:hypothetical protein [Armatimonadia bacterium]
MTIVSLPVTISEALSYAILWAVMMGLLLAVGRLRRPARRTQWLVAGVTVTAVLVALVLAFRFDADEGEHLH